jgi:chondroitin AC lyase
MSVNYSDRVELFICKNDKMETYYCAEVDPNGKVLDYTAYFHRKFDFEWDLDQLQTATSMQEDGYTVEGALPLDWLQKNNILSSNGEFYLGLFRANASDPTKEETIVWLTWNIPDAKEPDFHIPGYALVYRQIRRWLSGLPRFRFCVQPGQKPTDIYDYAP